MTRRVLILAYDFPPRGATSVFRVAKFVRYLPDWGWEPVVVAAAVSGGVLDAALLRQLPPDLEVLRVPNPFAPGGSGLGTHSAAPSLKARARQGLRRLMVPDAQMLWVPAAVRAAATRLDQGDIDALFSTAPPYSVHMAALWLKRRKPTLPWLMDLRDIWSYNPAIGSLAAHKLQRACEAACLAAADHVTTATDGQRRLILNEFGLPPERISTITNGFDSADLPDPSPRSVGGPVRVLYVGSIIGNRASATRGLFDALEQLQSEGVSGAELEVRLVGIFDQRIHAWAAPLAPSGLVTVDPFVPQAAAYAAMAASDALLLLAANDAEGRLSHPNKLFEYLAVGRPMLAIVPDGDVARLVREAGAGEVVAPDDAPGIAAALRRLVAAQRRGLLPDAPDGAARFGQFERRELTRQLAARLDELAP